MKNSLKKLVVIILIVSCVAVAVFSFSGCDTIREIRQVQQRAETAANRGNAAVIAQVANTHNVLCDDDKYIYTLPETKAELDAIDLVVPLTMEEEDYQNALPYVFIDEEGDFRVKDE